MREKVTTLFIIIAYLFAFGSSVYCMNLLLQKISGSKSDYLSLSFLVCVFVLSFIINFNKKD